MLILFVAWLVNATPLLSHCAPTIFVDQIENGSATVISQESGAAWQVSTRYLPADTAEGDTIHLCGYFKLADDGVEGASDDTEAKRAALGAADTGETIYLDDAPMTAEVR